MKKIILFVLMTIATTAFAQHGHYRHGHYHGPVVVHRDNWIGPLVGGVVLGAIIADANRPAVVQPPVIIQKPSVVLHQSSWQNFCTEWKEIMTADGTVYKERTCYQR